MSDTTQRYSYSVGLGNVLITFDGYGQSVMDVVAHLAERHADTIPRRNELAADILALLTQAREQLAEQWLQGAVVWHGRWDTRPPEMPGRDDG